MLFRRGVCRRICKKFVDVRLKKREKEKSRKCLAEVNFKIIYIVTGNELA